MGYPYVFPLGSNSFKNVVSNPSASLCGNFINTLLKLPLLLYQFISTMIDTGGNLTVTFMAMIYTPGDIKVSAAAQITSPVWLLCDGSEYAQTTYPDLYAAIGDIYGTAPWPAPSNPANFRVPNYQYQTLIGVGSVTGSVASPPTGPFFQGHSVAIGGQVGEDMHVLVPGEDVPHQHMQVNTDTANANTPSPTSTTYIVESSGAGSNTAADYDLVADTTIPSVGPGAVAGGVVSTDSDAIAFPQYTSNYKANPHNSVQPSVGVYLYCFAGVPVA